MISQGVKLTGPVSGTLAVPEVRAGLDASLLSDALASTCALGLFHVKQC